MELWISIRGNIKAIALIALHERVVFGNGALRKAVAENGVVFDDVLAQRLAMKTLADVTLAFEEFHTAVDEFRGVRCAGLVKVLGGAGGGVAHGGLCCLLVNGEGWIWSSAVIGFIFIVVF